MCLAWRRGMAPPVSAWPGFFTIEAVKCSRRGRWAEPGLVQGARAIRTSPFRVAFTPRSFATGHALATPFSV